MSSTYRLADYQQERLKLRAQLNTELGNLYADVRLGSTEQATRRAELYERYALDLDDLELKYPRTAQVSAAQLNEQVDERYLTQLLEHGTPTQRHQEASHLLVECAQLNEQYEERLRKLLLLTADLPEVGVALQQLTEQVTAAHTEAYLNAVGELELHRQPLQELSTVLTEELVSAPTQFKLYVCQVEQVGPDNVLQHATAKSYDLFKFRTGAELQRQLQKDFSGYAKGNVSLALVNPAELRSRFSSTLSCLSGFFPVLIKTSLTGAAGEPLKDALLQDVGRLCDLFSSLSKLYRTIPAAVVWELVGDRLAHDDRTQRQLRQVTDLGPYLEQAFQGTDTVAYAKERIGQVSDPKLLSALIGKHLRLVDVAALKTYLDRRGLPAETADEVDLVMLSGNVDTQQLAKALQLKSPQELVSQELPGFKLDWEGVFFSALNSFWIGEVERVSYRNQPYIFEFSA